MEIKKLFFACAFLVLLCQGFSQNANQDPFFRTPEDFCPNADYGLMRFLGLPDAYGFLYLSLGALVASFMVFLLVFLVAKIIDHPQAGAILAIKLSDIATILLILIAFSVLYASFYVPNDGLAKKYMSNAWNLEVSVLQNINLRYVPTLMITNQMFYAFYNFQFPLSIGKNNIFGFHLNLGPIFKPVIDISTTAANYIGIVQGEFIARIYFLCFIHSGILTILFPMGVFLRSFAPTRGAGAALMAISIAFFFVYPAMLSMNYAIYKMTFDEELDVLKLTELSAMSNFNKMFNTLGSGAMLIFVYKMVSSAFGGFGGGILFKYSGLLIISIFTLMTIKLVIATILELVQMMIIFGFILPALNIFITLNIAREISKLLGAELELSTFTRMI